MSPVRALLDAISHLREADPAPVYVQVERCVRLLVADGTLHPGQRLPPVRTLARELDVAPNTVARAYMDLVNEGIVVSRAGGGSVVAARAPTSAGDVDPSSRERLQQVARHLVAYSLALGHSPGEVVHAVRAELAAFGRAEATPAKPAIEIRPELPTHTVPAAARAPSTDARLEVHGLVARARSRGKYDLAGLTRATVEQPFACDEGWVVPSLRWSGVWLTAVLALAEPLPEARLVRVGANSYAVPLTLEESSGALLADELDGRPLALEHGAPWRLILPGGACYTSVKWVDRLELVAEPAHP